MASAIDTPPPVLAAALEYAARGIPVFPCRADNKRPHLEHGFKDASTDSATIRSWWRRWPDAMVACPTGSSIGAWVLDVDEPATFEAAASALGLSLPATRRASTGKGYHLYFRQLPDAPIRNTQRTAKGWAFPDLPGADTRGDGGYIILPPSRHPSGRLYEWQRDEDASDAPEELLAIVRAPKLRPARESSLIVVESRSGEDTRYGLSALDDECQAIMQAPAGAQEMTLNSAGLKIGALVAGGELTMRTAKFRLIGAALTMPSHHANDPWDPTAVCAKIERALSDGAAQPRGAPALRVIRSAGVAPSVEELPKAQAAEPDYCFGDDGPSRPVIQIRAGELHMMATEAEAALVAAKAPLYVRGGLVRPVVDEMPAAHGKRTKVARLVPVTSAKDSHTKQLIWRAVKS